MTGTPQETLGGLLNASFGTLVRPVVGGLDDSMGTNPNGLDDIEDHRIEVILNEQLNEKRSLGLVVLW